MVSIKAKAKITAFLDVVRASRVPSHLAELTAQMAFDNPSNTASPSVSALGQVHLPRTKGPPKEAHILIDAAGYHGQRANALMPFGATTELDERMLQFCAWFYSKTDLQAIARNRSSQNYFRILSVLNVTGWF